MATTPDISAQQKRRGSKKLAVIAVLTIFLGLGGGGFWFMSHRGLSSSTGSTRESPQPDPLKKGPASVFQLETFVVNLADTDQNAYLRVGIALGLDKPLSQEGKSEKSSSFTPQIRDAILGVLSTWHSGDLLASDGRTKLKEALLKALQEKVPALGVVDIYFTDFLIQH